MPIKLKQSISQKRNAYFVPSAEMEVGGARIPWSDKIKYLGVHLDTK